MRALCAQREAAARSTAPEIRLADARRGESSSHRTNEPRKRQRVAARNPDPGSHVSRSAYLGAWGVQEGRMSPQRRSPLAWPEKERQTNNQNGQKMKRETGEGSGVFGAGNGRGRKLVKAKELVGKVHKPSRSLKGKGAKSGSKKGKRVEPREDGEGEKKTSRISLKGILGSC